MKSRLATIWPRKNYTADTTEIIDIDINDPISQIIVTYEPDNNGGVVDANGHPAKCVSKIEIVDGSEVIYSLTGQEAQAIDFYHNSRTPPNQIFYANGMTSVMIFNLNFGRYLWDEILALDPKRFNNLQMKITLDIDAGGTLSNDGYLTVMAQTFDEKIITPNGFIMHKRIKQYTLANDAHEYTDLPTDYSYKNIFLMMQRYGTVPESQIDTVKLTEDNDKKIPLNHKLYELVYNMLAQWPEYIEWVIGAGSTTAYYKYCTPGHWPVLGGAFWRNAVGFGQLSFYNAHGGRFQQIQDVAGGNWQANIRGHMPHCVIPVLPKSPDDIADYYDVTKLGSLKLDLTGGAAVGASQTAEILLQQYRPY